MRETSTPVKVETIEERMKSDSGYAAKFNAALPGQPIDIDTIAFALAAFERTLEPATTPFDRWVAGDETAISAAAKRGFALFNGKAACVACHAIQGTTAGGAIGPNLTLFGRRGTVAGWLENNPDNLARWITAPQSIKPGAKMPGVAEPGGDFPAPTLGAPVVGKDTAGPAESRAAIKYEWHPLGSAIANRHVEFSVATPSSRVIG